MAALSRGTDRWTCGYCEILYQACPALSVGLMSRRALSHSRHACFPSANPRSELLVSLVLSGQDKPRSHYSLKAARSPILNRSRFEGFISPTVRGGDVDGVTRAVVPSTAWTVSPLFVSPSAANALNRSATTWG